MNNKIAIDLKYLRNVIEDDRELEKELFIMFIENGKKNIQKMDKSISENNSNDWYMASHAFKGASSSIGAFDLSRALEIAQHSYLDDQQRKNEILATIKKEFDYVITFINLEL